MKMEERSAQYQSRSHETRHGSEAPGRHKQPVRQSGYQDDAVKPVMKQALRGPSAKG